MKYILISVGTRGDIEPFLAIGLQLKENGHSVKTMFPEQFGEVVANTGLDFFPLSASFLELIHGEEGRIAMGGKASLFRKVTAYIRLYRKSLEINRQMVDQQAEILARELPDYVLFNGKATYPFIWSFSHVGKAILISPIPCLIHAIRSRPHVGFKKNYGYVINKLTYKLANYAFVNNIRSTARKHIQQRGISRSEVKKALLSCKMWHTISPSVFERPSDWPAHVQIIGHHEREQRASFSPSSELMHFLDQHPKILFVTFGSMLNPDPVATTQLILYVVDQLQIPTLINTASRGLTNLPAELYDDTLVHFVEGLPYDWILPQVYAVMHHGGSGTIHLGLKYGCPSLIIPHIIDQFLWRDIVVDAGAGPRGESVQNLSKHKLLSMLHKLWINKQYLRNAQAIAERMNDEKLSHNWLEELQS